MDNSVLLFLLVAVACLTVAESAPRERRRARPNPKKPLTLEELDYECQYHRWSRCRDKTRELLSEVSNTSIEHRSCITNAVRARVSPVSVDPLQIAVVPPAGPDEEAMTTGNDPKPQTNENPSESCTLDGEAKERAREHYCNSLIFSSGIFVHNIMDNDPVNIGLPGLAQCRLVNYYDSDEVFTPDELLTSLTAWYTKMVERHHCCDKYGGLLRLNKDTEVYFCPDTKYEATLKWDELLSEVATMMKKVELLEALGRRRKCLRGCVGIEEVMCCDIK